MATQIVIHIKSFYAIISRPPNFRYTKATDFAHTQNYDKKEHTFRADTPTIKLKCDWQR